jgi:hypothetical protein
MGFDGMSDGNPGAIRVGREKLDQRVKAIAGAPEQAGLELTLIPNCW